MVTPGLLPAPARGCWRPVVVAGRVVDLVLVDVLGDPSAVGLPAREEGLGALLSALFPDAGADGRLAAFCRVAETGVPLRLPRPASAHRPAAVLRVERRDDGLVTAFFERRDRVPGQPVPTRDEHRWQRLFSDSPLGVLVTSLDGRVLEANPAVCAMFERALEDLVGRRLNDFSHPTERALRMDKALLMRTGHATLQKRYLRGDGGDVWLRMASSLVIEDGVPRTLALCEDVTQAQRALAELAHRAAHDDLTGLGNREALHARLGELVRQVRTGEREGMGLLFLDLDRFKVVNDSLGHAVGDRLLRDVAARLRAGTPEDDVLARLGGDEFAVVTGEADAAPALAARLVEALARPFAVEGREVTVGASIGIAVRTRAGADPQERDPADALLREADTAMYAAKRSGSGPVVVFQETLRRRALARLEDEQGLRRALARGELRVHYQPIVALPAAEPVGVEALVRWQHPERGLLGPGAFLQTAEETGLVVPLGRFVLAQACRQVAAWRARGRTLRLSVNIAAQHLAAGTLGADVEQALADAGLDPSVLTLEITEQALVVSHEHAASGPRRAALPRLPGRAGRLRHRLQLAGVPAPPAGRRPQDRPDVRHRRGHRRQRRRPARGDHPARREPRARDRHRGHRDRRGARRGRRGGRDARAGLPAGPPRPGLTGRGERASRRGPLVRRQRRRTGSSASLRADKRALARADLDRRGLAARSARASRCGQTSSSGRPACPPAATSYGLADVAASGQGEVCGPLVRRQRRRTAPRPSLRADKRALARADLDCRALAARSARASRCGRTSTPYGRGSVRRHPVPPFGASAAVHRGHTTCTRSADPPLSGCTSAQPSAPKRTSPERDSASPQAVSPWPCHQPCTSPAGSRPPSGSRPDPVAATEALFFAASEIRRAVTSSGAGCPRASPPARRPRPRRRRAPRSCGSSRRLRLSSAKPVERRQPRPRGPTAARRPRRWAAG